MTAAFGKLQGHTLELKDGLNIIQAPNETGKSTWCAFLLAMLYGINSRERDRAGFIADKNRYAPWNGTPMSGRMDCRFQDCELTLLRTTKRSTAPMGEFRAVYSGTSEPFPGLTGLTCGETLLGVTREVFERSAFIRQAGLPISQDAGLERRIAALITSGEEDISYTEAVALLKKQLNRRRHNKTGELPALEAELRGIQRQLSDLEQLEQQLAAVRAQAAELADQEASLAAQLDLHDRWETAQQRQALHDAETAAVQAERQTALLRQRIEAEHIPENETIGRLRGAIVNLNTTRKAVDKARAERDEAMKALLKAEAAVNGSPFAGQTPEQAQRSAQTPPTVRVSHRSGLAVCLAGLALSAAVSILLFQYCSPLGSPWNLLPGGVFLLLLGVTGLLSHVIRGRALKKAQDAALLKRFGTSDQSAIREMADTYTTLWEAQAAAQASAAAKSAAADSLYASLSSNEQAILLEVRRFAPSAFDLSTADQLLRGCAVRRRELSEAERAAQEARMRWELQKQSCSAVPVPDSRLTPPAKPRAAVTAELESVRAALTAARSAADRLTGQLHALGDPVVLRSSAEHLTGQISDLEQEYDAIRLSIDALDTANAELQSRFSPALGRRTAEIFGELTGHRYRNVLLDRDLRLSAEPAGNMVYRDASLLSAGTADQLYLAARLAICDLVLPKENKVPIILDDALANFDDDRCAAALRWLKQAAQDRQILLFTCHSREAAFFSGDEKVSVQRLTDAV